MQTSKGQKLLESVAFVARVGNKIIGISLNIIAIVVFLFGLYVTIDTWQVFKGAGVSSGILNYKPVLISKDAENPSVKELVAVYPDARAWLTVYDTNIDYPILQSDDNSYYLNRDIDGNFSLSGEIFLDVRNTGDFSDKHSVVYGHHMEMNAMFGGLDLFTDQDYLEEHTYGVLFLPEHSDEIEIFACVRTDAYDSVIFDTMVTTEQEQNELLEQIELQSVTFRDIEIDFDDRIIALATCSSSGTNARTVVFGILY